MGKQNLRQWILAIRTIKSIKRITQISNAQLSHPHVSSVRQFKTLHFKHQSVRLNRLKFLNAFNCWYALKYITRTSYLLSVQIIGKVQCEFWAWYGEAYILSTVIAERAKFIRIGWILWVLSITVIWRKFRDQMVKSQTNLENMRIDMNKCSLFVWNLKKKIILTEVFKLKTWRNIAACRMQTWMCNNIAFVGNFNNFVFFVRGSLWGLTRTKNIVFNESTLPIHMCLKKKKQ